MMNEKNLREQLEIDTKLELLKEHKCCAESILCIETYMYCIELESQQLKEQLKQRDEIIDDAINKLGRYADEMTNNGNAYAICVDLLDKLKNTKEITMDKENKIILLNQLRIMSAMQRLEYFIHQQEIEEDLSEGIKDTQKILANDIDNKLSIQQENINLKQALSEIREYIHETNKKEGLSQCIDTGKKLNGILQIIDKYMKEDDKN